MQISKQAFQEFKKIIDRVLASPRSDFYRKKFARENFDSKHDLNTVSDIVRVPRLTREELSSTSPFERLYVEPQDIKYIRYTSGTSGAPALLLFRPEQRYHIPGKRPLILTANNQLDAYFAQAPRLADPPYFPPLIHSAQSSAATALLAEMYGIDAIVGLPSRMLLLAKELPESLRTNITHLFIQGERFTHSLAEELKFYFPNAILDPRYGMTEVGLFGYQCPALREEREGKYHCEEDYLIEITDPKTGAWISGSQEGEILVTELYESPHQIIRYHTGDAGRILNNEKCSCGAAFSFEVTGRIEHDIIKVAGGIIRTDEIERVIGELKEWFEPDFRGLVELVGSGEKVRPVFTLSLILKPDASAHPGNLEIARQEIAQRLFLTPNKTLSDFLAEKWLTDFKIVLVKEFPQETKAQRLRFKERL